MTSPKGATATTPKTPAVEALKSPILAGLLAATIDEAVPALRERWTGSGDGARNLTPRESLELDALTKLGGDLVRATTVPAAGVS